MKVTKKKVKIKVSKSKKTKNNISDNLTKKKISLLNNDQIEKLKNSSYSNLVEEAINNTLFEKNFFLKKEKDELIKESLKKIVSNKKDNKIDVEGDIYPDLDDEDFNYKINKKKEFIDFFHNKKNQDFHQEVEDLISKRKSNIFNLSLPQKFLKNYISPETPYNSILLMHGTGVGKTCSAITIAEQFIPYVLKYDQKIIIISSELIGKQFIKEIFDIDNYLQYRKKPDFDINKYSGCTDNKYLKLLESMYDKQSLSNDDFFRKEMKKLINSRYYEPVGYKKFANEVIKREKDAIVNIPENNLNEIEKAKSKARERYYSNSVIIIDELHNIKDDDNTDTKNIPPIIEKVIRDGKNNKLILLTATPMFNSATEIIYILNLLLYNDKRNPISKSEIFDNEGYLLEKGKEKLSKVLNSYISYVKGQNPYIFPFRLYPDINKDPNVFNINKYPQYDFKSNTKISKDDINILQDIKIIGSVMKKPQFNSYLNYYKSGSLNTKNHNNENNLESKKDNHTPICMISTFSFPQGEMGQKSYKKYFEAKTHNGPFSYRPETIDKYGYFLSRDLIGNYSCKFSTILEYILKSSGPIFVYTEWVWNGVIPFALMLEQNGYKRFGDNNQLLNEKKENISYDGRYESSFKNNEKFIQGNYIILTGQQQGINENNRELSINVFNSPENKDGKLIKVFLASKAGSEGLDLKGIREVHICDPWWNFNRNEQTIGRAIRNFSHLNSPLEKRNVTVFNHAIINPTNSLLSNTETIDLYKYRTSMKKKIIINEIEDLIKKRAVDCYLNKNINFFPKKEIDYTLNIITSQNKTVKYVVGDEENSHNKDIKCNPDFKISKKDIDINTYTEYFEQDLKEEIKKKIKNLFLNNSLLTINNILSISDKNNFKIEKEIIFKALNEIIDNKEEIQGSFGRNGTLIYRNGYYIFYDKNKSLNSLSDKNLEIPISYKNNFGSINLKNSLIMNKMDDNNQNIENYIENIVKILLQDINIKKINLDDRFWINKEDILLQLLYDLVIDSLDKSKKEILSQEILKYYKTNNPSINSKILESSEIYIYKLNDLDNNFYKVIENYDINFFYIHPKYPNNSNDQNFIKAKKNINSEILKKIKFNSRKSKIYGYMINEEFKVVNNISIDNISSGVVCTNLKKHMIAYSINELIGYDKYNNDGILKHTNKKTKIQKPNLCIELQLILRYLQKYNNEHQIFFIRDFELYNFIKN